MRIAVLGAGAVGCYLAARLSTRGHGVTLIGREAQADAIRRAGGIALIEADGSERRYPVAAATDLTGPIDLLLLAVKTQDLARACEEVRVRGRLEGAPAVTLQNGVRADGIAADVLGAERILGAVVVSALTSLEPGRVTVHLPGWLVLGEPFGPPTLRTHAIHAVLQDAVTTYLTGDLRAARWSKLLVNLTNAITGATGLTLPEIAREPLGRRLSLRAQREGYAVGRASGERLDRAWYGLRPAALMSRADASLLALLQAAMPLLITRVPEPLADRILERAGTTRLGGIPFRGSTWQSLARGRPTEVEYLNGEIVRRGAELGIPVPFNARLVEAVEQVERTGTFLPLDALWPPSVARERPRAEARA